MADLVLKGLPGSAFSAYFGAKAEPFRNGVGMLAGLPPGTPDATGAIAAGEATVTVPDAQQAIVFCTASGVLVGTRLVMAGYTRSRPTLDALTPNTMASNSGDKVLQISGHGLTRSSELYFGSGAQKEPLRPDFENKVATTVIKTGLWAPGTQPVYVINAGIKSNVLTFTFT